MTFVASVENITSDLHFYEKKQIEQLEVSVMRSLIRACFAAILVATIVGPAASDPVPPDTPWAVLRCVGNDVDPSIYLKTPVPPAYANNTEGFLKDMFTATGKGKGGLYDYWGQVSQNPDLMKGTSLFPWVTLDMSNLQYWNLPIPTGEQPLRTFVQTCLDQYIKKGTATVGTGQPNDLNSYYGLIVISYIPTASGEQGRHDLPLTINGAPWRASTNVPAVGTTFDSISPKAMGHEMGHGYGLDHASCASKPSNDPDKDYCDSYDVMGDYGALYTNSNFALSLSVTNPSHSSTAAANLGWSGPGLNAPHLAYLGWIPSARTCALGTGACEFVTGGLEVTLAALGHSEAPGVFQVGIPSSIAPLGGYTVEFRRASTCASPSISPCWDQAVPDSVQIHAGWEPKGQSHTLLVDDRGGALWAPGQMFDDGAVQILIETFNLAANTATIKVRWGSAYVPPPGRVSGPRACEAAGGTWVCGEPLIGHRCGCEF